MNVPPPVKVDVVLISGKQGSGKSTLARELRELVSNFTHENKLLWTFSEEIFAGVIYEMHDCCRGILRANGIIPKGVKDGPLLQFLGTEWGRKVYGGDVWVEILRNKIQSLANAHRVFGVERLIVVVPDLRFKNELEVWEGSFKVRLECSEEVRKARCTMWRDNTGHQSEIDLDDRVASFDVVFDSAHLKPKEMAEYIFSQLLCKAT